MRIKLIYSSSLILMVLIFFSGCKTRPDKTGSEELIYGDGDYIYGAEIDSWGEEIKQQQREHAQAFMEKLSEVVQSGAGEINLEEQHYRFNTEHLDNIENAFITISDVSDITINGNGAQFWFEDYLTALQIQDAQNITFNDLTMDYDPLTFSQVKVTSVDSGGSYFEAKTEPGFRNMMKLNSKKCNDIIIGEPTSNPDLNNIIIDHSRIKEDFKQASVEFLDNQHIRGFRMRFIFMPHSLSTSFHMENERMIK